MNDSTNSLGEIIVRFENFMVDQIDRLDSMIDEQVTMAADSTRVNESSVSQSSANDASSFDELERAKQEFESYRRSQIEIIENDSQQLLQAWSNLEAEQRKLLASKSVGKSTTVATARAAPATTESNQLRVPTSLTGERASNSSQVTASKTNNLTYDQLQRAIRTHAAYRKK